MDTALILAGGLGKRLRPLTYRVPKPLIKVGGKPIIAWQLELLKSYGVRRVVVLAGYKAGALVDAIGDGSSMGVSVLYSIEEEPLGTAGAVKKAIPLVGSDSFYVLNGDVITNLDLRQLADAMERTGALAAIAAVEMTSPYGVIVSEGDYVVDFREKPVLKDVWINAGVALMKREVERYLPSKGSLEEDVYPKLAKMKKLAVQKYRGVYWKSVDSHKDLEEVNKALQHTNLF